METNLRDLFTKIRDIPYRIPLSLKEEDFSCTGKNNQLKLLLEKEGYLVRWKVCSFRWDSIDLPKEVSRVSHEGVCTHAYLEVQIEGKWKTVDATWDSLLASVLPVSEWNGKTDTAIAISPVEIFSPEKSLEIIRNESQDAIEKDLEINGDFYAAFNNWLEKIRTKSN